MQQDGEDRGRARGEIRRGRSALGRGAALLRSARRAAAEAVPREALDPGHARLAEVAHRTGSPVMLTDLEARIEWVNDAFTRLTGWTLAEVRGQRPGPLLQTPQTDPATRALMARAVAARQPFRCEVLNRARDGRQYWLDIDATVARDERGAPRGFLAIQADVTERRVAERKERLAERIAGLLLESDDQAGAGRAVVEALVGELDIRVAQLWVVEPGQPTLRYLAGAAAESAVASGLAFLEATRALPFRAGPEPVMGVGIPGVTWGRARHFVQPHLTKAADRWPSRRLQAAAEAGVQTFCGTPILGEDGVLGVLEIGGTAFYPGHEQLPSLMARVEEQLASFLLHDTSRRAFASVFEHSPDGLLLVDGEGVVLDANARAHALFGAVRGTSIDAVIDGGAALTRATLADEAASGGRLIDRTARGLGGPFPAELGAAAVPSATARTAVLSVRDLTERRRLEEALTRSLGEKETLLKEVHHRVKNNLQIVSSLLSLQAENLPEGVARGALSESVHRVRAMSFVHQQLYGSSDLDRVDLAEYARTLCSSLQQSLDPGAAFHFELERAELAIDRAIPCGLLLNELVTNALKHGRSADGRCEVTVEVRPGADGNLLLRVSDRGPGFQATTRPGSLGVQLVRSLARQLRAPVERSKGPGATVTVRVPPAEPVGPAPR